VTADCLDSLPPALIRRLVADADRAHPTAVKPLADEAFVLNLFLLKRRLIQLGRLDDP